MHKEETITIRIPTKILKKINQYREWKGEPWYSIIERILKEYR